MILDSNAPPAAARTVIIGIDEAGRGALAGPVVAGACILERHRRYPVTIKDSKQMTCEERERSYEWLIKNCIQGVGSVDACTIDRIGILAATERAMQQAVACIAGHRGNLYLLVDGCDGFWFDWPHSSIIRGDRLEPCIGAASIIAKVTRDRFMVESSQQFPEYDFSEHKGYGTPEHLALIRKHGPSAFHRRTFLKKMTLLYCYIVILSYCSQATFDGCLLTI